MQMGMLLCVSFPPPAAAAPASSAVCSETGIITVLDGGIMAYRWLLSCDAKVFLPWSATRGMSGLERRQPARAVWADVGNLFCKVGHG